MFLAGIICLLLISLSLCTVIARQEKMLARLSHRVNQLEKKNDLELDERDASNRSSVKLAGDSYCIAIFSAQFSPHIGGVESFTENLAAVLAKRGHKVLVVTNNTEGLEPHEFPSGGIEVIRFPCFPLLNGRFPFPRPCREWNDLHDSLLRRHFDGILINTRFYPHSLIGLSVAKHAGITPIVLDHGSNYLCLGNPLIDAMLRRYEDAITAFGKREYDAVYYGISQKSVAWLNHFGIKAKGIISNSIDAQHFRALSSQRQFDAEFPSFLQYRYKAVYIGRLVPEKGIIEMLQAAQNPQLKKKKVLFIFAGRGPLEHLFRNTEDNVVFLGSLDKADVSALLQQVDINLLPSRSEGFSTNLLEASACGCPSICTDVGGARELIPNELVGTILPDASCKSIVAAINNLCNNPQLLEQQSKACKALVEAQYSWSRAANAFEEAIISVRKPQ